MRHWFTVLLAAAVLVPAHAAERMTGRYAQGIQVSLFEPCGTEEALWVLEEGAERLVAAHRELTSTAYEGVYAEISATREAMPVDAGIPEEYDAVLRVDTVYELRGSLPAGCR